MTYRVALLALASAALLGGPLGGLAEAIEGDRSSLLAQTLRLDEPPTSTGTEPGAAPFTPEETDPQATPGSATQTTTSLPSEEVRALQEQLVQLGYSPGAVDGVLGNTTREAISQFQRDVGLATTGLPDPLTMRQLQAAENPLGILPESPSAATDTTDASDAPDAVTDGQTDLASTPLDGVDGSTEPLLEEANPSPGEAENGDRGGGLIRFVLVGMVIAAMGIAGAVAVLFFFRRAPASSVDSDLAADATATPIADKTPTAAPVPAQSTSPTPSPSPPTAEPPHNGHSPESTPAQSSALAPETTTKLVPVNIVDELVQDLQNPDPAQRRKAIWELGQRGNSTAVQPLARLMLDADSKERSLILAALAEISTQTLKPMNRALALSLQDENPEVRKNAIRDMTRIYDLMGQAGTMLNHAATDSDPEVRQTASWAMEQLERMRFKAVNPDISSLPGHNGSET